MKKKLCLLPFVLASLAATSAFSRPASDTEARAAYCEALLQPQIEMHKSLPAVAKDAAMDAQNAQAIAHLKRISAYLAPRRSSIDASTFTQAQERYKADIRESTQVSKACHKKCMADVMADPSKLQSGSCRKPTNCANPAEDRLNQCHSLGWLPN